MSDHSRLSLSLFLCRLSVALVFFAWAYDKLKVGFGLHGVGTSDWVMKEYYYLDLPPAFFAVVGVAHMAVVGFILLGLFKGPVRGYVLALSAAPFLLPNYWKGLYDAIFVIPHPTITFFSSTALIACAYMVFKLRDYDNLVSLNPKRSADFSDPDFHKKLSLALYFCRVAVFIVFMVWINSKIVWPEKGVVRMERFWLIPGFPEWGVVAFAWAQLVISFAFLLGFFKRWTAAFFVFLGVMAAFSPRAMKGMGRVFTDDSWHTIILYPGTSLLVCSIVLYLLRDYDTRFNLGGKGRL